MLRFLYTCLGCLLPVAMAAAAPPKLNYLFPPGAQRGRTITVTANGSWDTWPVVAWVDRPGLSFVPSEQKGKFQVSVDPDTPAGTYWIRLTTTDGASALKPFLVGTLPEVEEQEPNDDPSKPLRLTQATLVNGQLGKRGDVDTVAVSLRQGETLVVSLQANEILRSDVDAVLQICSPQRFVLDQNDDARGLDPLLVFSAPADGEYLIRVFGFPATPNSSISFAGDDRYLYRLTVTTSGFADYALPMAVQAGLSQEIELRGWNIGDPVRCTVAGAAADDFVPLFRPELAGSLQLPVLPHPVLVAHADSGPDRPQPIAVSSTVTGLIEAPRDEDVFTFVAQKAKPLEFVVESDQLGFLLDGSLAVTDLAGKVLAEADDTRQSRDPQLTFNPPADGEYRIAIRDVHGHGGPRYVYRMTARETQPAFSLKLPSDTFTVKRGGTVEVAVSIERDKGFDAEIELVASGLPAGISCPPVKSEAQGDSAKKVQLVLQASDTAESGTFQILGKTSGDRPAERKALVTGDGVPANWNQAWLTAIPGNAVPGK